MVEVGGGCPCSRIRSSSLMRDFSRLFIIHPSSTYAFRHVVPSYPRYMALSLCGVYVLTYRSKMSQGRVLFDPTHSCSLFCQTSFSSSVRNVATKLFVIGQPRTKDRSVFLTTSDTSSTQQPVQRSPRLIFHFNLNELGYLERCGIS